MVTSAIVMLTDVVVKPPRDGEQLVVIALAAELAHNGREASGIAGTSIWRDVLLRVGVVDLAERRSHRDLRRVRVPLDMTAHWRA
jgi:hypothetical protein